MQKAFELCPIKCARKPVKGVDEGSDMYVFFESSVWLQLENSLRGE